MFRLDVAPVPMLHVETADGRHTVELEQIDDCEEFHEFMEAFMDTLDSIAAAGEESDRAAGA
jgi:ribosome maturation factor RimP